MKKNKFKFFSKRTLRIIIIGAPIAFLLLNEGSRHVAVRLYEKRTLTKNIKNAQHENFLLRQRLHNIENDPSYLEKMVKRELGVISAGEIEYRITSKYKKNKAKT